MRLHSITTTLLLLPFFIFAQDKSKLLDQYMSSQASLHEFSGNAMVVHKGKVVYKKAFGMANREWNIPNSIETKFRIGSITKQFTSAAILQLVEKGKIRLDDKLSSFFPAFPKADSVTIHMLLNHTSGIKGYTDIKNFRSIAALPYSKDSVLALVSREPYDFSPGTMYTYSNSGYFILGYIIEKVSGQSYDAYINEYLIQKIGLKNTGLDRLDSIIPNRSSGYIMPMGNYKNAPFISMEFPFSAGAIFSTVDDIYQWQKALFTGKVLSADLFKKMTTPYLKNYGYGLHVDSFYNHAHIGHNGGISGYSSSSEYYPSDDLYIVVLSNNVSDAPFIGKALAAIMFDIPIVQPYKHKEVKIDHSILEKYVGRYLASDGTIINLIKKNNKLYRKTEGGVEFELAAESPTKFFAVNGRDNQVEFSLDQNGSVVKVELIRSGVKTEMVKVVQSTASLN
ncbi:MAG: serine hydrolase [Flavisolibacter sp.]